MTHASHATMCTHIFGKPAPLFQIFDSGITFTAPSIRVISSITFKSNFILLKVNVIAIGWLRVADQSAVSAIAFPYSLHSITNNNNNNIESIHSTSKKELLFIEPIGLASLFSLWNCKCCCFVYREYQAFSAYRCLPAWLFFVC